MSEDWYLTPFWDDTDKKWTVSQSKRKAAKDLMQDKPTLETMSFFSFIGLQPTKFENCWLVEFSLRDYQQYFHIADRDKSYIDLADRLDDVMATWDDSKENSISFISYHLIEGYDYTNGIIRVGVTEKGKELIEKLRSMEDER